MPLSRAAWSSLSFILRLALAMSTVPLIIAEMPVPEPPPVTATATLGLTCLYSSAQAWATLTSVSEPLFWITARPLPSSPEGRPQAITSSGIIIRQSLRIGFCSFSVRVLSLHAAAATIYLRLQPAPHARRRHCSKPEIVVHTLRTWV